MTEQEMRWHDSNGLAGQASHALADIHNQIPEGSLCDKSGYALKPATAED